MKVFIRKAYALTGLLWIAMPQAAAQNNAGGTVQGTAGKPLARATVALVPNERRANPALYRNTFSDATGKPPGDYKLFAWPNATYGAHFNAEFVAKYEDDGKPITIPSGSRLRIDVSAYHGEGR